MAKRKNDKEMAVTKLKKAKVWEAAEKPAPKAKAKANAKATYSSSEDDSDSDSAADELESSEYNSDESDSESGKKKAALDESESESEPARDVAAKATDSELELESGKKKAADSPKGKTAVVLKEEVKPKLFKRVWWEKDEITLLQGMIDFKVDKNVDPMLNYSEFHAYIKDLLDGDFDQTQVSRKIPSLLGKYKNYLNGKKKYLKPHEQDTISLSKQVWGTNLNKPAASTSTKKRTTRAAALKGKERNNDWNFADNLQMLLEMKEDVVNEALKKMKKMDTSEKEVIEETWKEFFSDEASLFATKLEAIKAHVMKKK